MRTDEQLTDRPFGSDAPGASSDGNQLMVWLREARRRWVVVSLLFALGAGAGLAAAFLIPRAYRAEIVVMPIESRDVPQGLSNLLGGLGAIASLAGVGGQSATRQEALEFLKSRGFTAQFIERHKLTEELYPERLDASGRAWKKGRQPTRNDAVLRFQRKIFELLEDRRTGVVRVGITSPNRAVVAQWANDYVADANQALRARAMTDARKSLEYLRRELETTREVGIQQAISKLSEAQLNQIMLASVREDYAFKVIDPATTPDLNKPVRPNRPLLFLMGCAAGMLLAGAQVIARSRRRGAH
jgi:uncharacterized protein involved in exopolysaccharide biosynthesis